MSEARIGRISNENSTAGPIISGITTISGQNYFVPPKGTTAERPSNCPVGSIRFNTDSAKLEYFDGLQWLEMEAFNVELGVSGALGNRGVYAAGYFPYYNTIDYITISTIGNAIDFGDLITATYGASSSSSSTRGIFAGGGTPAEAGTNTINYITISSTGNALDFGDLTGGKTDHASCSSSTRSVTAGGVVGPAASNVIEYITIASTGNGVDFGDLQVVAQFGGDAACSSSTRGIFAARTSPNFGGIDYITISTLGNSIDFGTLSTNRLVSGGSNSTRGLFAGGYVDNVIDYITISTTGNAQDFGDLTQARGLLAISTDSTRAVFDGGRFLSPTTTASNIMDYVTIATTGNALDFGDLTLGRHRLCACSNGHGGL